MFGVRETATDVVAGGYLIPRKTLIGWSPHLAGRDNVEIVRRLRSLPPSETDRVLALAGLLDASRRRAAGYSQGMKQRLAIARAIYRNPTVLVFDEATSALDAESERAIQENMESLFQGRTVFVVAHRLSTIRDADWTLVLEQGRIAELGSHDELIDRRGLYFYLVSRQVEQ